MTTSAAPDWRPCRVVESELVGDGIRRITLERPAAQGRPAEPGSHVDVRLALRDAPDAPVDERSYSVVESDPTGRLLTVTVRLADPGRGGSAAMHRLVVGDTVSATRPLQNFPLVTGADRYLLLAGGIGVTALVAMARSLARLGADFSVVYVGRTRGVMAYADLLVAEHGDRVSLHVEDEGTELDLDALVDEVAAARSQGHGRTELMMCGPVRLMDAVRRRWSVCGLSPVDLRFETFGNSGWFDPESFEVSLPEAGVTATVGPDQSILDALTAAGADLMWDCRKGECGLCTMAVTDLDGELDHRDVFLGDEQRARGDRACLCVTRVVAGAGREPGRARLTVATPR